ncbi:MAG: hypothetical protein IPI59_15200 [Sphingobacteriales bacterium]|nr:hypothetical protein [Sphingobacteriales bacterium]MBK7528843.1 hypothetical protein [Sphingobacteriales bacterium]
MKNPILTPILIASAVALLASGCFFIATHFYNAASLLLSHQNRPPTDGGTIVRTEAEEDGDNKQKRQQWFEQMHRADPNTKWQTIEAETQWNKYGEWLRNRTEGKSRGGNELLANGNLYGNWNERGSSNNAGSVGPTDLDPQQSSQVYTIGAGGTIFKGNLDGTNWAPINDKLRFDWGLFDVFMHNATKYMVANRGAHAYRSGDNGITFTEATGLAGPQAWGFIKKGLVLNNANRTIYLLCQEWDYVNWVEITTIYKSTDQGQNYTQIAAISGTQGNADIYALPNDSTLYVIENSQKLSKIISGSSTLTVLSSGSSLPAGATVYLAGFQQGATTILNLYSNEKIYRSTDFGVNWTFKGNAPVGTWCGMSSSSKTADYLYLGGVNCYRSYDAGANWTLVNEWWEYYGNVEGKLHADMMHIKSFKNGNSEFILISNHGGLNISSDNLQTVTNIGMLGLNVGQYYSVYTNKVFPSRVYVGTQDQGFQRTITDDGIGTEPFEQVISGDYGHIVSSNNGNSIWMNYPGFTDYYASPHNSNSTAGWDFNGANYFWIPPLMADPFNPAIAYLAGGNLGGGGSRMIKLDATGGSINPTELGYDFEDQSEGGHISAMSYSTINKNHWYVLTDNGHFFYSTNKGVTWTESTTLTGLGAHYFYGATIYPSKTTLGTVYIGGSGYSNAPAWVSYNNGETFTDISSGLPSTLVFQLTGNDDETLLFAATEAGPYVYVVAENEWYDMSGLGAPLQTYWTVEYIPAIKTVRFGTYGRGIWDFVVLPIPQPFTIKVNALLQGPYNTGAGTMSTLLNNANLIPLAQPFNKTPWDYTGTENVATIPANVTDWVLLEVFRKSDTVSVERRAAFLRNDGVVIDTDGQEGAVFNNLISGNEYFVAVRSRNHLAVISKNAYSVPLIAPIDLTVANNVMGVNQLFITGGKGLMFCGDINADGVITIADFNIYAQQSSAVNQYLSGDINLDKNVTIADYNAYAPNSSLIGVKAIRY